MTEAEHASSTPTPSEDEEQIYGYTTPAGQAALVAAFAAVGIVIGVVGYPAEWSLFARIGMGAVTGVGAVLCVYVNRFLF